MRKVAREIAFMLVYEGEFNKKRNFEISFDFFKNDKELLENNLLTTEDEKYIKNIIEIYEDKRDEVSELISKYLIGYEKNRVYKIDNALLILALIEIYYIKTPVAIVINEVLELSKKYSTEKSFKFINGILGAINKDIPVNNFLKG